MFDIEMFKRRMSNMSSDHGNASGMDGSKQHEISRQWIQLGLNELLQAETVDDVAFILGYLPHDGARNASRIIQEHIAT